LLQLTANGVLKMQVGYRTNSICIVVSFKRSIVYELKAFAYWFRLNAALSTNLKHLYSGLV